MAKTSKQDATDSAVGYYYQGLYAILLLFAQQDDGCVSVETSDDIQQDGPGGRRLTQLKHSLGRPAPLSEKNDGFWKTIAFWIPHLSSPHVTFAFVTCAQIAEGSALCGLTDEGGATLPEVMAALDAEARRVMEAVAATKEHPEPDKPRPFAQRGPGCEAYLALSLQEREALVSRLRIYAAAPSVRAIESVVADHLITYPRGCDPWAGQAAC